MPRVILLMILLFFLPFLFYAGYVAVIGRSKEADTPIVALSLIGTLLAVGTLASFVYFDITSEKDQSRKASEKTEQTKDNRAKPVPAQ